MGTDSEGRDIEKAGLEGVGGGDDTCVVGRGLKWEDRRKDGAGSEEILVGGVL
jgi:hypothetical protein